ncbi:major histocompatibility complex class I-related gene protein-like [Chaetodon trifascialis]|uniref:major histocompatibility complex class I-related gene protein-like n=1 Tax=Chaetodon trifascialis TaxID=109706 RepID=UPI00399673EC
MEKLLLLLLLCRVSSPVQHSLKYFVTGSSAVHNVPEFMGAAEVDGIVMGYCDTDRKIVEPKQELVERFFEMNPDQLEWHSGECFDAQPNFFRIVINSLKQLFNQSGGVHVLQRVSGCGCDEETGEIQSFYQYGYDGEDFLSFDLKTLTWIALKPEARPIKRRWDTKEAEIEHAAVLLRHTCPDLLKRHVVFFKSLLERKERPSVSLLQKTPSSPVSCHASGFFPDRATLIWRKDGEEIHEDVELGEILPNHDGTFQTSADLNVSSVPPEDWRRYDCVFHLSGVEDDMVTKLDKAAIRTNWVSPPEFPVIIVVGVVIGLLLLILFITGLFMWRRNNNGFQVCRAANTLDTSPQLSAISLDRISSPDQYCSGN